MSTQTEVAAAPDEAGPRTVSIVAWIEALPGAPWLTGVLVFGLLVLVNLVVEGVSPPGADSASIFLRRTGYLLAAVLGYLFGITPYVVRWSQRDLDELRPDLVCSDRVFSRLRRSLAWHPLRPLAVSALVSLGLGTLFLEEALSAISRALSERSLFVVWIVLRGLLMWSVIGPSFYLFFKNASTMRRVGTEFLRLDLLDPDAIRPLARSGLRGVPFVVVLAVTYVLILTTSASGARMLLGVGALQMLVIAVSLVLTLLPVSGLRRRIRALKGEELARIRAALAGNRAALAGSLLGDDAQAMGKLELLAWRRELEAVREWPFPAPVRARAFFWVFLPLLSWIASALVERGLDVVLGR
jgi:hypothetical protein